ncbi:L-2-hydroxyglutarate dehydrogenase,mitochondrial [Wickerhamomyces ciferrii]|uniref:L-2-hydroxyglutarate dehydrogenase, mitochondrial n=1 Tax=Wickerhamomyces ciferrii (strain ATCC 14091 / BCRC 22168 / CBS 111 / JCM 3599 / NBRC 0793 / NRRL Y-1031 F-60-10) TaxID=1206466 RepID=K0KEH3_WICCF|nr:L-2-hydroxyglutarate dehydrogenase,mitochondrial [Wickerhamomyces ciferrii]CCH41301.1 L-2-hydroxyglutarate dehydrogenase,mitochondrial [Wickerhamomyces ciferrii]
MLRSKGILGIRRFSSSRSTLADYSHAVIGAGVVGLAIAAELSKNPGNKVVLIEKNTKIGEETSSRNSEVIHAGLYYPKDSLKAQLCIEGKELLYKEAFRAGVDMQKCGKWIVAQTDVEDAYIENIYWKSKDLGVNTELIPVAKGRYIEPAIHAERGILSSPTSGIISAHSLMDYLYTIFQENDGELAVGSIVTGLSKTHDGYEILAKSTQENEEVQISVNNVVNSAGLYADKISNLLLPSDRHVKHYYAKGNYFNFSNSFPQVRRLIYPVPKKGTKSLGTHLTLGLDGQIKFGPDLEWVDSPTDYKPSAGNKLEALKEIQRYFPHIIEQDLEPAYSGIRSKLIGPDNTSFQDFVIREEEGFPGFVNLLGIESPGLTASMAIGKYVSKIYHG